MQYRAIFNYITHRLGRGPSPLSAQAGWQTVNERDSVDLLSSCHHCSINLLKPMGFLWIYTGVTKLIWALCVYWCWTLYHVVYTRWSSFLSVFLCALNETVSLCFPHLYSKDCVHVDLQGLPMKIPQLMHMYVQNIKILRNFLKKKTLTTKYNHAWSRILKPL